MSRDPARTPMVSMGRRGGHMKNAINCFPETRQQQSLCLIVACRLPRETLSPCARWQPAVSPAHRRPAGLRARNGKDSCQRHPICVWSRRFYWRRGNINTRSGQTTDRLGSRYVTSWPTKLDEFHDGIKDASGTITATRTTDVRQRITERTSRRTSRKRCDERISFAAPRFRLSSMLTGALDVYGWWPIYDVMKAVYFQAAVGCSAVVDRGYFGRRPLCVNMRRSSIRNL